MAKSPFLSEQLRGPVYLLSQTGRSLPGLLLDLQGPRAREDPDHDIARQQHADPVAGDRLAAAAGLGAPDRAQRRQDHGRLHEPQDLCFKSSSSSEFRTVNAVSKLEGWNGKNTGDVKFAASVLGCGPGVSARLSGATGSRPKLTVTVTKHPNAPNMKEIELTLSSNLALVKSRLSGGATGTAAVDLGGASFTYVSSRKLKVSGLPAAGSGKVTIRLSKGAVRSATGHRTCSSAAAAAGSG